MSRSHAWPLQTGPLTAFFTFTLGLCWTACGVGCSDRRTGGVAVEAGASFQENADATSGADARPTELPEAAADGGGDSALDEDAGIDLDAAAQTLRRYHSVLHLGDSMVGGKGGLTRALEHRFQAAGVRFYSKSLTNESIIRFSRDEDAFGIIARLHPDMVLVTLGANDVDSPQPKILASFIRSIAKKIAPRACYWISPPLWKEDTGLTEVLRANVAPCAFFDSSHIELERWKDGIHPTNDAGEKWADLFFRRLVANEGCRSGDTPSAAP